MGVYIKGMEMPISCWDCLLNTYGYCMASDEHSGIIPSDAPIPDWCPLVSVPPHGRLGDLDELDKKHEKLSRDFCHGYFKSSWDFVCALRKLFEDAPTIIPAEEGE